MAPAWLGAEDDCFLGFRLEGSHFSVAKVYEKEGFCVLLILVESELYIGEGKAM